MPPRREEFFHDVRRAVRLEQQPKVTTDSDVLSDQSIARALHGAALWLTPKVVEKYSAEDFAGWTAEARHLLGSAVEDFRVAAGAVAPAQAPTRDQFSQAQATFQRLTAAVTEVVLGEWMQTVGLLVCQIEGWVLENGWRARRVDRTLSETLLGAFTLPQLQVFADADLYVFEPLARFMSGAAGAYDLSIQPSSYITTLYRDFNGVWYAHLDVGQGAAGVRRQVWNRETFRESLEELRSLV